MQEDPNIVVAPEEGQTIPERVRRMLDNPGFYIGSAPELGDGEVPLVVAEGRVFSMRVDSELAPDRFIVGHRIEGPFRVHRPPAEGPPTYAWSTDDESYHGCFDSREDAAAAAFEEDEEADTAWTGRRVTPVRVADADDLIERVAVRTSDEAGEWADDYLYDVPKPVVAELQAALQALWDAWERRHKLEPAWFNVEDAKEHKRP